MHQVRERTVSPARAKALVDAGREVALLDLREAGPYSEGHPLFAVNCPFSRFERRLWPLVPRLDAPLLLLDDGDGLAEVAAAAAEGLGYRDVRVVAGGAPGWAAAGLTLYQGVHVPSKTLGELAEETCHPKTIGPETLARWQREGRAFRLIDCRPPDEHAKMTVPGARCVPNGELAHRLPALAGDGPLVLTCAGRTRGLIGAATLTLIDPEAEVIALENGTQGWALAGLDLARGNDAAPLPALDAKGRAQTRARAEALVAKHGIPVADPASVPELLAEPGRTTYLFDVRAEAAEDPLPAFTPVLSGQLVQATDRWVAVRGARVLLADDLGLRAAVAALWLRKIGLDAQVLLLDEALRTLAPRAAPALPEPAEAIEPDAALTAVAAGTARLVDVRPSSDHAAGHVAGAVWAIRPHLADLVRSGPAPLLIDGGDGRAALAAAEFVRLGRGDVRVVRGGHAALRAAGAKIDSAPPMPLHQAIDQVSFAHGRHDGNLDASRTYLRWEQGLTGLLDPSERAAFRL